MSRLLRRKLMDATMTVMTAPILQPRDRLASPDLRRMVERIVRKRVPEGEVDDVVQTILCDAIAAAEVPDEDESMRRWLVGIARHKVADFYRKRGKAKLVELPEQLEAEPPPHEAREWARWADKQVEGNDDAARTLNWMAREGSGEKLAHIAEDEALPHAQVRQRVSRLRRMMKQRWMAELAAVAGVGVALLIAWYLLRKPEEVVRPMPVPAPEIAPTTAPVDPRIELGIEQRKLALESCATSRRHDDWHRCLKLLDDAAKLDPDGDQAQGVQAVREQARQALELPDPSSDESDSDSDSDSIGPSKRDAPRPTPTGTPSSAVPPKSTSAPPPPPPKTIITKPMKGPTSSDVNIDPSPQQLAPSKGPQQPALFPNGNKNSEDRAIQGRRDAEQKKAVQQQRSRK